MAKEFSFNGSAWHDPDTKRTYGGQIGTYQGGILTDVSDIEAKVVLEELLGLARPDYALDACCTIVNTPELVLSVDTETISAGQAKLQPLEESKIIDKAFSRTNFECDLNEVHVVVEDRAAMKASHDVLRLNIADAARELAKLRNDAIATAFETATDTDDGGDWDDSDDGTDNPMIAVGASIATIKCAGYPVDYLALNPIDWNYFINHESISRLVYAGLLKVGDSGGVLTLPGWPTVKVIVDCAIDQDFAYVGSQRAIILANGPTESVKYRNELKRYTGYLIRQYEQPKIVVQSAIIELHPITA
jgi:hypothetical protein